MYYGKVRSHTCQRKIMAELCIQMHGSHGLDILLLVSLTMCCILHQSIANRNFTSVLNNKGICGREKLAEIFC